jgi:putative methionine-R-sulfoxide reductase with GAF domain/GGDEF domain-containing protein
MRVSIASRWAEALAAGFLVPAFGLLAPGDPSFAAAGFYPQLLAATVVAALLGTGPGAASLVASALGSWLLPLAAVARGAPLEPASASALLEAARFPAAAGICAVAAAGSLRDASERRYRRIMRRLRVLVHRERRLSRMTDTFGLLNDELETRVVNQRESLSALYSRITRMDTPMLGEALDGLLDAVRFFAQADVASVYEFDKSGDALALRAWTGTKPAETLSLDESIEGWVYRNEAPFSLRMLDAYPNLARVDERRSILAYPLRSGDMPWGVLNIEAMSFYRYSPVTEKNLNIIVALAAAYIKKAVEFRERVLLRPRNAITGMPGYVEFARMLDEEIIRRKTIRASLSVVLMEFLDFQSLVFAHSGVKALGLVKAVAESAVKGRNIFAFHYKEESQVAFLLPGVDRDGAALFCLEVTQIVGAGPWEIDGENQRLEPAFGIAATGASAEAETQAGAQSMLSEAERILTLSRQAAAGHGDA